MRFFDLAVLRSFVLIAEGRSFAETASLVGRSASAVTQQIRKLETDINLPVFIRTARRVELTAAGERLLGHARRILLINDEAMTIFHEAPKSILRFGTTQDIAETALPQVLRYFRMNHPEVTLSVRIDRSQELVNMVHEQQIDLAIAFRQDDPLSREVIWEEPMLWLGSRDFMLPADGHVPLALFDLPCSFRAAALDALGHAGYRSEIIFSSPSLTGLCACAETGTALTVRTRQMMSNTELIDVGAHLGLPGLPSVEFAVYSVIDGLPDANTALIALVRDLLRGQKF